MVAAHVQLQGLWIFQDEYCCRSIPGYLTPFFLYINPSFMLLSFYPYISMYPYIYISLYIYLSYSCSFGFTSVLPSGKLTCGYFLKNSPSNVCWFLINFIKYIHSSLSLPHLLRWFTSKTVYQPVFFRGVTVTVDRRWPRGRQAEAGPAGLRRLWRRGAGGRDQVGRCVAQSGGPQNVRPPR